MNDENNQNETVRLRWTNTLRKVTDNKRNT